MYKTVVGYTISKKKAFIVIRTSALGYPGLAMGVKDETTLQTKN